MKRPFAFFVLAVTVFALALPGPAVAELQRRTLAPAPPAAVERRSQARSPVVERRDWPLKRERRRNVVVHPSRFKVRIRVEPKVYVPSILFPGVPIIPVPVPVPGSRYDRDDYRRYGEPDRGRDYGEYRRDRLVWESSETLYRDEEWTEFTLDCEASGEKLWFEVRNGRARIDWAEVVFANGEVQVVDFSERSIGPGLYPLLDFRDGRRVDHVSMVAKAVSREVTLVLRIQK